MKKMIIATLTLALVITTAIGTATLSVDTVSAEAISSASIKQQYTSEPSKTVQNSNTTPVATSPTNLQNPEVQKLLNELINLQEIENKLDLEEDALRASYRKGEISFTSYKTQMLQLEKQDDELDLKEDQIERELRNLGYYENRDYNNFVDHDDNDYDDDYYDLDDHDDNDYDDDDDDHYDRDDHDGEDD